MLACSHVWALRSISLWKVAGGLQSPKGITLNSYSPSPSVVQNAAFRQFLSETSTCQYPPVRYLDWSVVMDSFERSFQRKAKEVLVGFFLCHSPKVCLGVSSILCRGRHLCVLIHLVYGSLFYIECYLCVLSLPQVMVQNYLLLSFIF